MKLLLCIILSITRSKTNQINAYYVKTITFFLIITVIFYDKHRLFYNKKLAILIL